MTPEEYNYAVFPRDADDPVFAAFAEGLKVGRRAPDPCLIELASGHAVQLRDLTQDGLLVLEFGSFT